MYKLFLSYKSIILLFFERKKKHPNVYSQPKYLCNEFIMVETFPSLITQTINLA